MEDEILKHAKKQHCQIVSNTNSNMQYAICKEIYVMRKMISSNKNTQWRYSLVHHSKSESVTMKHFAAKADLG